MRQILLKAAYAFSSPFFFSSFHFRTEISPCFCHSFQNPECSVSVWSLQVWHLPLTLLGLSLSWSLHKLQPFSLSSLQSFSSTAAGHLVPVEKCCIPEASGAASAGESPPGTMGGPMDEGCQRLVRLFPTYTAL